MLVSEFMDEVNRAYRGSDDTAPAVGETVYAEWLGNANRKMRAWARDPKQKWGSLWEEREIGTMTTSREWEMDEEFIRPSDEIIIDKAGVKTIRTVRKPAERNEFLNSVYFAGRNPQTLWFNDTIAADDPIVGGTLLVPGYWLPDDMTDETDEIPVDDPDWLVYATASELAFNDPIYEEKYIDLNTKANDLYMQMIDSNRQGTHKNPRKIKTSVNRIRGTETR